MRGLFLPLFMFILSAKALGASSCSEITNQLVLLESQIQSQRMPKCEGSNRDHCCHQDVPYSCTSFLDLQNQRNALMGKLVIYEGIIAIGKSIEADHESIKKISPEKMDKARKHIDDFLTGYKKAALLTESMDINFWVREDGSVYNGESVEELVAYTLSQCQESNTKNKEFCEHLKNAGKESGVNQDEIYLSLHNFAMADNNAHLDPRDRELSYKDYKKALELKIAGKTVNYKADAQQITRIRKMRDILANSKEELKEKDAIYLASHAKALDGISVNYGALVNPREKFESFFNENIKKSVADFNQSSRALLRKDSLIENMEKISKAMETNIASSLFSIESEMKEATDCKGSGDTLTSCFEKLCNAGKQGVCKQDPSNPRQQPKLQAIKDKFETLPELERMKDMADAAKACMEKPVTDPEARKCADQIRKALQIASVDRANEMKTKVHQLEAAMENMNFADKIQDLKMSKAMGLMALKHKGCLPEQNQVKINDLKAHCVGVDINSFSHQAVKLGEDTQKILDFSNNPFLNKDLSMGNNNFAAYKNQFLEKCEEGTVDLVLCSIYEHDEVANGALNQRIKTINRNMIAAKTKANTLPKKANFSKAYKAKGGQAFFKGFGESLLTSGVPFYMNYENSRQNHKMFMNYHENRLSYMQSQYDFYQDYYENNPTIKYYTYPWSNYGLQIYDYNNAKTFGGSTSSNFYSKAYDFSQYNFPAPMVMDQFSSTNFR